MLGSSDISSSSPYPIIINSRKTVNWGCFKQHTMHVPAAFMFPWICFVFFPLHVSRQPTVIWCECGLSSAGTSIACMIVLSLRFDAFESCRGPSTYQQFELFEHRIHTPNNTINFLFQHRPRMIEKQMVPSARKVDAYCCRGPWIC